MYLTKKQWTIIAVVAGLVAIYFLFLRKKDNKESGFAQAPKGGAIKEGGANNPQPQAQVICTGRQVRCSGCFWNYWRDYCSSSGGCGSCGSRITNPSN